MGRAKFGSGYTTSRAISSLLCSRSALCNNQCINKEACIKVIEGAELRGHHHATCDMSDYEDMQEASPKPRGRSKRSGYDASLIVPFPCPSLLSSSPLYQHVYIASLPTLTAKEWTISAERQATERLLDHLCSPAPAASAATPKLGPPPR